MNDKFELQQELENYINMITTKSKHKQYVCPLCGSGTGEHHTGALSIKVDSDGVPRATCFACYGFKNSDIFEAVGKVENIKDFKEQFKKVSELLSCTTPINKNEKVVKKQEKAKTDFSAFYQKAKEFISFSNYLMLRGISQEVIDKFSLGYCDKWKHPNSDKMRDKAGIVIPISKYSYVFRDINAKGDYKYFRVKTSSNSEDKFFNFRVLTESNSPIYIVEGEIDALSVITAGQEAVALGSVNNVNDFFENCRELNIKAPLILFLDNDKAGLEATNVANEKLKEINLYRENNKLTPIIYKSLKVNEMFKTFSGLKDANDILKTLGAESFSCYLNGFSQKVISENKKANVASAVTNKKNSQNINLEIEDFIAEKKDIILNCIRNNKKTLLVAPMGTGKTRLIKEINQKIINTVTVIVNPSVAQLKQMQHDYNITAVYGDLTYDNESIVCVTPESLRKKVINKLNKPFVLIVDEAHSKYSLYNFRKCFGDINAVEKMALYTVYMTATPDILLEDGVEEFDAVIKVYKKNKITLNTKVLEVEDCTIEQKAALIKESLERSELVVLHNDNKKENEVICNKLNKELHIKTEIDSNFQLNMLGIAPRYTTVIKNTAVPLDASKRDSKEFINLTNESKIDKNVRLFCTTSCVQAGLNINNDRSTIIIYACNNKDFKNVNFLQSIGRYRCKENVKEVVLLKNKLDKTQVDFKNFSTLYNEEIDLARSLEKIINNYYKISRDKDIVISMAKIGGLTLNKETNKFEIDYNFIKAKAQRRYNKSLLYHPEILKKNLENNDATNLKVVIKEYKPKPETEIAEELKQKRKEKKEIFKNAIKEMATYEDTKLQQVLEYTVDQRKKENEKVVEVMKSYHETVSKNFSNLLKEVAEVIKIEETKAFKYIIRFETLQEAKDELLKIKVMEINELINQIGIDTVYADSLKVARGLPAECKKTVLIRYMLKDVEKKRGRISKELKQSIINKAIETKLYKIKNLDDTEKIRQDIEKHINMIYKFRDSHLIGSIKTKNSNYILAEK